jgi:thioredoxin reductase
MTSELKPPVAIIGAGPVGMAAAAHLAKRKIPFVLFESGPVVGSSIRSWKHVNVFSPWKYNIDKVARQLLTSAGWQAPDDEQVHSGAEFIDRYLLPLARLPIFKDSIFTDSKVISVGRKGLDKMKTDNRERMPFVLQVQQPDGIVTVEARAVIDASGTWLSPNPIGSGGSYAIGEISNNEKIVYAIPDVLDSNKSRYGNKSIAVVGGGHSSINTILELEKLKAEFPKTEISWILRKESLNSVYGGQEDDALQARGALGIKIETLVNDGRINVYTPFQVHEIRRSGNKLSLIGYQRDKRALIPDIDEVIANTGARPDFSFLREVRLGINNSIESTEAIADLIDPNIHSCGTVRPHGEKELRHPEKDFYIAGSKSYGRAPTFLMATGYEQVRSIVAALDGDFAAAQKVELELPETGVCSTGDGKDDCCGVASAPKNTKKADCCG